MSLVSDANIDVLMVDFFDYDAVLYIYARSNNEKIKEENIFHRK